MNSISTVVKTVIAKGGAIAAKVAFGLKKHAPKILTGFGIASMLGGTVWASVESTKLPGVINEHQTEMNDIHAQVTDGIITEEEGKKKIRRRYVLTTKKLGKMYVPALILSAGGGGCVVASHLTMAQRNASLAATATGLATTLDQVYTRMEDKLGKEKADEIRYDIREEEVPVEITNEDGTKTTVLEKVRMPHVNDRGPFERYFDKSSSDAWKDDIRQNKWFLQMSERYFNDVLRANGYLFLNEVLKYLGFKECAAGATFGWIYDPKSTRYRNCVDFGLNVNDEVTREFLSGHVNQVMLRFNVDGDILSQAKERQLIDA